MKPHFIFGILLLLILATDAFAESYECTNSEKNVFVTGKNNGENSVVFVKSTTEMTLNCFTSRFQNNQNGQNALAFICENGDQPPQIFAIFDNMTGMLDLNGQAEVSLTCKKTE